jgi:plastocyanin
VAITPPPAPPPAVPASLSITGTVTSHAKPLPVAVVYLEDAPIAPDAKMTAWIDNKQMAFGPFLTVIPVGGKVTFHNSDPFPHNVFSPDAEKFNMGTIAQGGAFVHTFPKAGTYSLLCNLHPGMLGYLVVTPSSYFGKTDGKGHFTIKAVPAGTYKITAWSPRLAPTTLSVTVMEKDATVDFDLQR